MQWLYICQISRQLIENKNDLLKLIKPKWRLQPRFQCHMKMDNTNRLADPENPGKYPGKYHCNQGQGVMANDLFDKSLT